MLTEKEEAFLKYWEANRKRHGETGYQLMTGLPLALLCGFGYWALMELLIWLNVFPRAGMSYNAVSSYGYTIIAGIIIFSFFFSLLSKRFRWEKRENFYKELIAKKNKQTNTQEQTNIS